MKALFFSLTTIVLSFSSLRAEDPKEWVKIANDEAKYQTLFPAKPEETSAKGSQKFVLERENGKVALLLMVNDIGKGVDIDNPEIVKATLGKVGESIVQRLKGSKLLTEKETKFGKYPAKEIDVESPQFGIYRTRVIFTGSRLYQVTILGPKEYQEGAEAKKFMESFKLGD